MEICSSCKKTQCHVISMAECSAYKPNDNKTITNTGQILKEADHIVDVNKKVIFESEEDALKIFNCFIGEKFSDSIQYLNRLKEYGYIRKSELQTLVEEAEEMYNNQENGSVDDVWSFRRHLIEVLYRVVAELKKDHPEFGGRK